MNSRNTTSKRRSPNSTDGESDESIDPVDENTTTTNNNNTKTRKKREELSVSACKCIKKETVKIIVKFN
jgi:hypothetical protein